MCCCGVLYALTPPRGSPSPPLSLSTSQDLRPPPRESISQENCPPPSRPPSAKHVHTFSQSYPLTQCRHELLPVTPWFWLWGGFPDISSENSSENSSGRSRRERCPGALEAVRPVRSATATATTGDPSRSATSARIGSRTRHLARGRPGARFPEVFRHVDGGGGV